MAYLIKLTRSAGRIAYNFCKRTASTSFSPIAYSEEILQAKTKDSPIVALESTIITHGMPYPQNLKTALEVENIIRGRGATPATVAILKGQLTVGLSEDQLSYLAQAKSAVKTSRRDLGPVLAAKRDGATTVAGTIIAADLAGIPVFVTGGIGGVHREGEHTLDISADLTELGRSSTLVVCSGVKSILDIGKTLEYLETQGVCVCAYGDTDEFPAFYTRRSGHRAPYCTATPHEAALLIHASKTLRLKSGIVVAVPIPEEYAMDELLIENAIEEALKDANLEGIKGKEVTPFILAAVARATEGASLDANIALIKNNAKVGADIAVELKKLKDINNLENSRNVGSSSSTKLSPGSRRGFHTSCCSRFKVQTGGGSDFPLFGSERKSEGDVLVIGGANVDRSYRLKEQEVQCKGSTSESRPHSAAGSALRRVNLRHFAVEIMSEENYRKKKSEAFFDSEDESVSIKKKAKSTAAPRKTAAARKAAPAPSTSSNVDAKAWLFSESEDEREEEQIREREHNSVYARRVAGGSIRRKAYLSGDLLAELRLFNPDEVRGLDGYERCEKAVVWLRYTGDSNSPELQALKKFLKIAKTKFTEEGTFFKTKK